MTFEQLTQEIKLMFEENANSDEKTIMSAFCKLVQQFVDDPKTTLEDMKRLSAIQNKIRPHRTN